MPDIITDGGNRNSEFNRLLAYLPNECGRFVRTHDGQFRGILKIRRREHDEFLFTVTYATR